MLGPSMPTKGGFLMLIGYARCSTVDQSLEIQIEALKKVGCQKIYEEKISGATTVRKELQKMMKRLERDDTLVVARLQRCLSIILPFPFKEGVVEAMSKLERPDA